MARKASGEASPDPHPDIPSMTFEAALGELEGIVGNLESGQVELQQSVDLYDRGVALRGHCEKKLQEARERVEKVVGAGAGREPMDGGNAPEDGDSGDGTDQAPPF